MSKYLDPKADLTFKRVFGEHKELTISFLNSLLDFSGDERICSIEYQTPEMLPDTSARKYSIVDVKCTDSLQRQFIVEMQMVWTTDFLKRILHNTTRAYSRQLRKGEDYASCMPVYTLCLLNENLPKDTFKRTERPVLLAERSPFDCSDFMHVFRLMEEGSPDHVIEGLNIVFVELKKFNPSTVMYKKMMVLYDDDDDDRIMIIICHIVVLLDKVSFCFSQFSDLINPLFIMVRKFQFSYTVNTT